MAKNGIVIVWSIVVVCTGESGLAVFEEYNVIAIFSWIENCQNLSLVIFGFTAIMCH